jgi:hypothetical protein
VKRLRTATSADRQLGPFSFSLLRPLTFCPPVG